MASRLRPTPESGTVAATSQPASAIGPSWSQRAGREARLAFRQAQRRGDREGAMRIAMGAGQAGLASQAGIGSAERRIAGQFQRGESDTAFTAEVAAALTPPGITEPGAGKIMTPVGPRREYEQSAPAASRFQNSQSVISGASASVVERPGVQEPPPAVQPGATEPPENPVTGTTTPELGDRRGLIGGKPARGVLNEMRDRIEPRKPAAAGGQDDFMDEVSRLTSPDGGDMLRGDAVDEVNRRRVAAGKPPLDRKEVLEAMLDRDRAASDMRARSNTLARGPVLTPDPELARSFRSGAGRAAAPAFTPASTAAGPAQPSPRPESPTLTRYTMTSPEARAAAQVAKLKEQALRARQGREALLAEKQREIKIPEWQEGTILGRLNRRFQEASLEAGMRTGTLQR